ncbi:efflux RND transporter periplasmic adaptor subunit [Cohnella silvisoli]|uniref:Efflux RND transporter periplasmic adaptor subunit n=1 Tax=Cohnella silvisoli TaxID=2873699 RepID=A0ABV1L163_9BACL|nr:efflux RND transporter periplasmic adaptor subunit [Cohnella silvisoli]MCD9025264.1 efflux RND transporter periplasmic adaptor subunit [Cohnella silvisoli]
MTKRTVRNVMISFIVMMIALTLFSTTLLQFTLPQVTLEAPGPGALSHYVSGSGTITAAEVSDLYADSETQWPVDQVKVEVGDRVKAGDTLVTFSTGDGKNALADEEARYRQQQLGLDKLHDDYITAQHSGDETQTRTLSRDIESARLDMQIQQRKINKLRQQLENGTSLKAAVSGIVTSVNVKEGLPLQGAVPAVSVTDSSKPLQLIATLPEEQAKYLIVGDETAVTVSSIDQAPTTGKISEIRSPLADGQDGQSGQQTQTDSKEILIDLEDNRLKGGEYAEFFINKQTKPVQTLISNGAVRENSDGNYVLLLKKRQGVLGDEYYAQQVKVITGDADETNTEIKSGIENRMDKVIVSSSSPVADGDRVRLAD